MALLLPTPQIPRPKSKASVTQQRAAAPRSPSTPGRAGRARSRRLTVTDLPLPPVPLPKQVALGLVGILVVPGLQRLLRRAPCRPCRPRAARRRPSWPRRRGRRTTNRAGPARTQRTSRIGMSLGIEATLSSRVVMAGRGQVSWLPGWSAAPSRGAGVRPSGRRAARARDFLDPVTVAGPRRFRTGLPLTTDRIYAGESIRRPRPEPPGSVARRRTALPSPDGVHRSLSIGSRLARSQPT